MGPFITRPRERILDHDEPPTRNHQAEPWDYTDSTPIVCITCGWTSTPTSSRGYMRALEAWRAHREAMRQVADQWQEDH